MPKYDIESFILDMKAMIIAQLNTNIAAISTEKGDGLELKSVDSDAIYIQTINDETINFDPFVLIGVVDPEVADAVVTDVLETHYVEIALCFIDDKDKMIGTKALRYSRALKEVFTGANRKNKNRFSFKVASMAPIPVRHRNSNQIYKAVGVRLQVTMD